MRPRKSVSATGSPSVRASFEVGSTLSRGAFGCTPAAELDELDVAIAAGTPGRRLLLEKKRAQLERAAASLRADTLQAALGSDLTRIAREVRRARARTNNPGAVNVTSLALLVERPRIADVGELLGSWTSRERGLDSAFYGPWPPYSFAARTDGSVRPP